MRDLFNGTAQITGTGICFVLIKYYLMSLIKWYNYKIRYFRKHLPHCCCYHLPRPHLLVTQAQLFATYFAVPFLYYVLSCMALSLIYYKWSDGILNELHCKYTYQWNMIFILKTVVIGSARKLLYETKQQNVSNICSE